MTSPSGIAAAAVTSVAIQPDNMVLVGGSFPGSDGYNDLGVARFNVDGSLDTGFNGSGYTTLSTGLYQASSAYGMAVQPDGGITVAGTSGDLANPADLSNTALLARITAGDIGGAQVSVDNASPSLPLSGAGYVAAGDTYSLTLGSPLTPGEGGAPRSGSMRADRVRASTLAPGPTSRILSIGTTAPTRRRLPPTIWLPPAIR